MSEPVSQRTGRHQPVTPRLGPADIATVRFGTIRRNGLNPEQVYPYLRRVAREVATLTREVAMATEENQRLKTVLVAWQAQLSPTQTPDGYLSRTTRTMTPRPLRDNEFPTDEWPTQLPYPHLGPDQP